VDTTNGQLFYLTLMMLIEQYSKPTVLAHGARAALVQNGLDTVLTEVIATAASKHGFLDHQEADGTVILVSYWDIHKLQFITTIFKRSGHVLGSHYSHHTYKAVYIATAGCSSMGAHRR